MGPRMGKLGELFSAMRHVAGAHPKASSGEGGAARAEAVRGEGEPASHASPPSGPQDQFTAARKPTLESFVRGREGGPPIPVAELVPDLERVKTAPELAERFSADLLLVKDQLIERPGLTAGERATRALEFFARYAERFVALTQEATVVAPSSGQPAAGALQVAVLIPEARKSAVEKLVRSLETLGFERLVDTHTGQDALQVARELLLARTPLEVQRRLQARAFSVGTISPDRLSQAPELPPLAFDSPPSAAPQAPPPARIGPDGPIDTLAPRYSSSAPSGQPEARRRSARWAHPDGRLGPRLLWNVLHRFRSGANAGDESAAQRDAMDQVAFAAIAVVVALGLLALVLVYL